MAVMINLPFGRGRLFEATQGRPLPDWAAEIDATTWAQIFLKYVVSHPSRPDRHPGHGAGALRRRQSRRGARPAAGRGDAAADGAVYRCPLRRARRRPGPRRRAHRRRAARSARRARPASRSSSCCSPAISCCGRCARRSASPAASTICSGCSLGTFVATLVVVPLYGWLSARVPRRRLLPATYIFSALVMTGFAFSLHGRPGQCLDRRAPSTSGCRCINLFVDLDRLEPDGRRVQHRAGPAAVRPDRRRREPRRPRRAAAARPAGRAARPCRPAAHLGRRCCCAPCACARCLLALARARTAGRDDADSPPAERIGGCDLGRPRR